MTLHASLHRLCQRIPPPSCHRSEELGSGPREIKTLTACTSCGSQLPYPLHRKVQLGNSPTDGSRCSPLSQADRTPPQKQCNKCLMAINAGWKTKTRYSCRTGAAVVANGGYTLTCQIMSGCWAQAHTPSSQDLMAAHSRRKLSLHGCPHAEGRGICPGQPHALLPGAPASSLGVHHA